MTPPPPFLFWISKGYLTRKAYAKFHGIIIAGYILNGFKWIFNILLLVALAVFLNLVFKVEPYPIPGSFLKLKYLKTELNVDNGTFAIV